MKITEHIYQVSGNAFGTNSSTYIVDVGTELLLFDAGYSDFQLEVIDKMLAHWDLTDKPITHTFLTHVHMDHAAKAKEMQRRGSRILIGEPDAYTMENGGAELLEKLFGREFPLCVADERLKDRDKFVFGEITVTCVSLPGHTAGSMGFIIEDGGIKCLVTGDFVMPRAVEPDESAQEIILSAMIKPGFMEKEYGESLKKAAELQVDILLTGHLFPFFGDVRKIMEEAYKKYITEEHVIIDTTAM